MELIIIISAVAALLFFVIFKLLNGKEDKKVMSQQSQSKIKTETEHNEESFVEPETEGLNDKLDNILAQLRNIIPFDSYKCPVNGFINFKLRGTQYQDLSDEDLGDFAGIAIAQNDNIYDEYAVLVLKYIGKGVYRKIGFAPRGNCELHRYIEQEGLNLTIGKGVLAYGTIWEEDDIFTGSVNIQFNSSILGKSKLEPEEKTIYDSPHLKAHRLYITDKAVEGRFYGHAELGDKNDFLIYNSDNELIGRVRNEKALYNTVKEFDGGSVEAWGCVGKTENPRAYHIVYIPGKCSKESIEKAKAAFKDMIYELR